MKPILTSAMEITLDVPPLHLFMEMKAKTTLPRLNVIQGRRVVFGSGERCNRNKDLLSNIFDWGELTDTQKSKVIYEHRFKCEVPPRKNWESFRRTNESIDTITCYTDGSLKEDIAGAGAYVKALNYKLSVPLGKGTSVFQAEVYAILKVVYELLARGVENKDILIFSDSQAAIKSMESSNVCSKLVEECIRALNHLGRNNKCTIAWVLGHSGIIGNEIADTLANEGAEASFMGPLPAFGWSFERYKNRLKKEMQEKHRISWNNLSTCKYTKTFIKRPDKSRAKLLISLKRHELRMVMAVVTGHGPFQEHLHKIGISPDALCQQCLEDDESAGHFLLECPAYERTRWFIFSRDNLFGSNELNIKGVNRILKYCKATKRMEQQ
jgi:ribonuclease HI